MNILMTWIDENTEGERAKLYRKIDPESISIIGHRVYFAHYGAWHTNSLHGRYQIDLDRCNHIMCDPEMISSEMERFNFPDEGDLGYYNHVAELKERK